MKKGAIIIILSILSHLSIGQNMSVKDSLSKLLPFVKDDTASVLLYINIGEQYESSEPDTAKYYYLMARDLSRKLDFKRGTIKFIIYYTYLLNLQGLFDSSLHLNLESVAISRQIKDSLNLAKTLFNTGTSYRLKGEYENAARYYEEGKELFKQFGNFNTAVQTDDILQLLYYDLKQYNRAIDYGEKAVAGSRKIEDLALLGVALNNLGLNYFMLKKYDKARIVFDEALNIALKTGDKNLEQSQYLNLGSILMEMGEYEKMKLYMEKALVLSKQLDNNESELIALNGLSFYYTFKKNFPLAEKYAKEALSISYNYNFKSKRIKVFTQLSNIFYALQDIKLGEYYATQSTLLGDSLLNENIQKNTLELEKKFETKQKEAIIRQLEADKKVQQLSISQKSMFNYFLIAGALTLLIILLLVYRTYKQKRKLQQQRIHELETLQQLTATEAVLKGEEQERTRLAKDLHDGLGGMLSGIKFSFNTMKGNLIMTPDNAKAFERSMDMLDSSIMEMRRVAHNMMPESLVKFGLDTALKDFCNDINKSGALQISYQSIGLDKVEIDQTTAITLYRIVQELINNTMKHAEAKTSIVQVTKSGSRLAVTIEDDGKGFDSAILNKTKGIGWSNIQNRVEFLKGTLDIRSGGEEGTSVHIEFNIP